MEFSDDVIDFLIEEGFDPQFGARPLRRVIENELQNKLARQLVAGEIIPDSRVRIDFKNGELVIDEVCEVDKVA